MSDGRLSDDDDLLAAELAFGLIEGDELAAAQSRLRRDAMFAAAHARWLSCAAAMFADPSEAPRAAVWRGIEARLPANDAASAVSVGALRRWKLGACAAGVAALALGFVAIQSPKTAVVRETSRPQSAAPFVAVLAGKAGLLTVSFDPASGYMTSVASGLDIGEHSPELWVIPADGKPRQMGVMKVASPSWVKVDPVAASAITPGVTIAVSVEPVGGSRTGQPTGPVILTGSMEAT